jgi:hypothetical protein
MNSPAEAAPWSSGSAVVRFVLRLAVTWCLGSQGDEVALEPGPIVATTAVLDVTVGRMK